MKIGGENVLVTHKQYNMAKVINSLNIRNFNTFLNPNGESRRITITGDEKATFSLTIKDSDGDSILYEELDVVSIPSGGVYVFNQKFPKLKDQYTFDYYDINITPTADVSLSKSITHSATRLSLSKPDLRIYQYKNQTVTLTNTTSQTGPALSVSGSDVTKTGKAGVYSENIPGYTSSTYTLTITENPSTSGNFYIKGNPRFNDNINSSTTFKKVLKRSDKLGTDASDISLDFNTSKSEADREGKTVTVSDIAPGMTAYGKVSYTKTVQSSVDATNRDELTSIFKLTDNHDLFVGMTVTGSSDGEYIETTLVALYEGFKDSVTLESKYTIRKGTVLTFTYEQRTLVSEVVNQNRVILDAATPLPSTTALTFDDDETIISGIMSWTGSGTNTIVLTITLDVIRFGKKDVTYTLDLDNFIVRKPNVYNQFVEVVKETAETIDMLKFDTDSDTQEKVPAIVTNPKHGTLSAYDTDTNTFTYTPFDGFTGEDSFVFTLSDSDSVVNSVNEEVSIKIK